MDPSSTEAGPRPRLPFLDNLRTAMIFLVVLYHAGAVYESSGIFASFWIVDDPATNDVAGLVNVVLDLVALPVLFFVSGYLAPASVERSGGRAFLGRRLRRLMLPWLAAVLTLIPLYKVIFLASRGLPREPWISYFHLTNGELGQSWLWFLPVLFLFDVFFVGLVRIRLPLPRIPLWAGGAAVAVLGTLWGWAVTLSGHTGWTKTALLDFQNERLLAYLLLFLLGALGHRLRIFDAPPAGKALFVAVACTAWIPVDLYVIVLLSLLLRPGTYFVSLPVDLMVLWASFHLSVLALLYLLVSGARRWWNRQGHVGRALAADAYGVYVVHLVVVGGLAFLLLSAPLPSMAKYALLAAGAWIGSNLLVRGYRAALHPLTTHGR